ncbi:MAG TPA: response regulator [Candidatus Dormibacteraeota bacterium]|nr:response regulator [Candidatus Dormibacteraeota bacterium]
MHFADANHVPILLAEDDDNDVLFMKLAFKRAGLENPLVAVHDGEEAIQYLRGEGIYADRQKFPLPCLLLTDLKMPRSNGFDLLEWLQEQPCLAHIPAIVLSSSDQPRDRQRALQLGAREYWVKPAQIQVLMKLVEHMRNTWVAAHCS